MTHRERMEGIMDGDQALRKFEDEVRALQKEYREAVTKLMEIPRAIPDERWQEEGAGITAKVNAKMLQLGERFRQRMDAITDEFASRVTGGVQ